MTPNVYHFQEKNKPIHGRISSEEALFHWQNTPFYDLAGPAEKLKNLKIESGNISYTMFRIINYTDICNIECTFCSFMSPEESGKGYVLSLGQIIEKTTEAYEKGFKQIFFQGGVNPQISFNYYIDSLSEIKRIFPDVHIRGFSPVEILSFSKFYKKTPEEIIKDLINSGLDSFPGAGAEILSTRMRNILSSKKTSPEEWYEIMRTALNLGLKASTNIVWGSTESDEEIIGHLEMIRKLQDETGNVLSFVPWNFQPQTKNFQTRHVPSAEYLKMVALSRLYLDNIDHIEVSLLVKGTQVGEIALNCGADDINSPVFEENVLRSFGLKSEKDCIEFITNAGFHPRKRTFNFEYL
jgi:cyclic dehypoxanthinyl futalosine synthase